MKVLITGSKGFIGSNLVSKLNELDITYITCDKENKLEDIGDEINSIDFIFHLAGINRPNNENDFSGNHDFTDEICNFIYEKKLQIPILYTSSIQAEKDNPYGRSKKLAEDRLLSFQEHNGSPVLIYRLINVFGKWCKPNYNSVVATFCHSAINDQPLKVNDKNAIVNLVYIDDVIDEFVSKLNIEEYDGNPFYEIDPVFEITVGELADKIISYKNISNTLTVPRSGIGFERALYATFLSYLQPDSFCYPLKANDDERGRFVEMIKTIDSGQVSFFTAAPGVTRGNHYHHTKNEQFFIIHGKANFEFKNIRTGESYRRIVDASTPEIIQTVPGWNHKLTNIGSDDLIVMLWANEVFDSENPDTIQLS